MYKYIRRPTIKTPIETQPGKTRKRHEEIPQSSQHPSTGQNSICIGGVCVCRQLKALRAIKSLDMQIGSATGPKIQPSERAQ